MLEGFWSAVTGAVVGTVKSAAIAPTLAPSIFLGKVTKGIATNRSSGTYPPPVTALTSPGAPPLALNQQVSSAANFLARTTPLSLFPSSKSGSLNVWTSPPVSAVDPQTVSAAAAAVGGTGAPSPSTIFDSAAPASQPIGMMAKFNAMSLPMKAAVVGGIGVAVYLGVKMLSRRGGAAGPAPKSEGA